MRSALLFILLTLPVCTFSQGIELVVPRYHNADIISMDLSPDGKFIISAGSDQKIFLREASTGNYLREFEDSQIRSIRFLADSKTFLIHTSNGIVIRDIGSHDVRQKIEVNAGWVSTNPNRNEFLVLKDSILSIYRETGSVYQATRTLTTPSRPRSCSYSQGGQKLVINDGLVKIVDLASGRFTTIPLESINPDSIQSLALHKNNSTLAIGLKNGLVYVLGINGKEGVDSLRLYESYWSGHYKRGIVKDSIVIGYPVRQVRFTESGDLLAYYSRAGNLEEIEETTNSGYADPADLDRMWTDLQKELDGRRTFPTQLIAVWDLGHRKTKYLQKNRDLDFPFSFCNEEIATRRGIENFRTGEKTLYDGVNPATKRAQFSVDGKKLLVDVNAITWIWNLTTGNNYILNHTLLPSNNLETHQNLIGVDASYQYGNPGFLDMNTGKLDRPIKVNGNAVSLNPILPQLAFRDYEKGLFVVDFSDERSLYHFYDSSGNYSYRFSRDGKFFICGNRILSSTDFSLVDTISTQHQYGVENAFLPQRHRLFIANTSNTIVVRDYRSHITLDTLTLLYNDNDEVVLDRDYHPSYDLRKPEFSLADITSLDASPDGKFLAVAVGSGKIIFIDPDNFKILKTMAADEVGVRSIDISSDNRFMIAVGTDGSIRLWDLKNYEVVASILFYGKDWVVVNKDRLFDGSAGGLAKLFFINGLQTIELDQLKTRYFEPGLLKKIVGGEKLRNVVGFNKVELPPEIRVGTVDSKGNLAVDVINRGGGIGEVAFYINGKEVIRDLRKPGADSKASALSFSIPMGSNKSLIPGMENFLAVKAWNAGQWIESRGKIVKYTPPSRNEIKPSIHILVCGVSDYTGDEIDLKYAAKDAEEMSFALELGAKRLFGTGKSYLYTLTTDQSQNLYPTKTNILKTFERISTTASSADVLVVYLSGHGINLGGSEGDFYYLTQEAFTASASAYNDPAIKQKTTLSSQELVELFKKVPALKQVLIIDACASGKVVDNLMAKRDIESSTLRALDRMKDRTGMHIITGCAADAVSYEASRYGQGVLTYSLLEGLRGLALREEKFVDVSTLFQFAQERVPVLASGIGGIQTPQLFSPNGSQSFDFGELTTEDKNQIPLARARPVYIRSTFIDEQKFRDVLGLGKKIDERLNEASTKGESSPLLFSDVSEYPDGCQLSGEYKQGQGKISLKLNKTCEGKEVLQNLEAENEKELIDKVLALLGK